MYQAPPDSFQSVPPYYMFPPPGGLPGQPPVYWVPMGHPAAANPALRPLSPASFRSRRARVFEDEDDEPDYSNMTQEEKKRARAERKVRKTNREKEKRSLVNDQFDTLCRVLHVDRQTRVEKLTVLNETFRAIHQLQAENRVLKEQNRQMKDLLEKKRAGQPIENPLAVFNGPQDPKMPASNPGSKRMRSKEKVEIKGEVDELVAPALPPRKTSYLSDERPAKKHFGGGETFLGTHERASLGEEPLSALSMVFNHATQPDTDFGYSLGDNFGWTKAPTDVMSQCQLSSECDFNPFQLDDMDFFSSPSCEDPCDLLC